MQRIPADLAVRAAGRRLRVPVCEELVPVAAKMDSIRVSLRSESPVTAKTGRGQLAGRLTEWNERTRSNSVCWSLIHCSFGIGSCLNEKVIPSRMNRF